MFSPLRRFVFSLGIALAVTAVSGPLAAQRYVVIDLGALGEFESFAADVNQYGQVVGTSNATTPNGSPKHAFRWHYGPMEDLGTLPGGLSSRARGINDYGWIAGSSGDASGFTQPVYQVYGYTDWIQIPHPGNEGTASDVANGGWVVGHFLQEEVPGNSEYHAFIWHPRTGLIDLSLVDGAVDSLAWAVNSGPQVGGWSYLPPPDSCLVGPWVSAVPTLWEIDWNGNWTAQAMPTGKDCYGQVYGLNEAGLLVGNTRFQALATHENPAVWRKQHGWWFVEHLPTPGDPSGSAYDVNVSEQIVGSLGNRAHLWECGQAIDLNDEIAAGTGWELLRATAINDAGEIVGYGRKNGGFYRAFLLISHYGSPPC